jgi:hypothetical protein
VSEIIYPFGRELPFYRLDVPIQQVFRAHPPNKPGSNHLFQDCVACRPRFAAYKTVSIWSMWPNREDRPCLILAEGYDGHFGDICEHCRKKWRAGQRPPTLTLHVTGHTALRG